jgi:ubiquinone biosynthesis protein UbiJ
VLLPYIEALNSSHNLYRMFKPPTFLITKPLNYLVEQTGWAKKRLQNFSGKSIAFNIFPWTYYLTIDINGSWESAANDELPDAVFTLTPFAGLRFMQGDREAQQTIKVEGDMLFAKDIAYIFQNLRWDYEEDISKVFGDVIAHRIGSLIRSITSWAKHSSQSVAENFRDYWVQEKPVVASTQAINEFNKEVDVLRDDVERFEKRLQKLAK